MSFSKLGRLLLCGCLFLGACFAAPAAHADKERIIVERGKGLYLPHIGEVESVFVADTNIADITSSPDEAVYLFGKSVGETSLIATTLDGGEAYHFDVSVIHNLDDLNRSLQTRFGGENIAVQATRGSILVTGVVSNERVRGDVLATLEGSLPNTTILDRLAVTESNLIRLDVALYEVNRSRVEEYGVDWQALVSNTRANIVEALNLLASNGVAAIVTETSMTTISGKSANFAVGGEVPIPTFAGTSDTANSQFSLDFKFVGMNLDFVPEQLNNDLLRLDIQSTISSARGQSATVNGNSFPTLSSRRFQTTVELGDQQSFVLAGLSKRETFADIEDRNPNNPFSGVARSLFSQDEASMERQELIIVVVPRFKNIAGPSIAQRLARPVSNLEYILSQRAASDKEGAPRLHIQGNAGFEY